MRTVLSLLLLTILWSAYQVWAYPVPIRWSAIPVAVVHVSFGWGYHRYALYPRDGSCCQVAFQARGCAGTYGQTGSIRYPKARDWYWGLRRRFVQRAWTTEKSTFARVLVGSQEWRGELTGADADWLHSTWCASEAARWDLENLRGPVPEILIPGWDHRPSDLYGVSRIW